MLCWHTRCKVNVHKMLFLGYTFFFQLENRTFNEKKNPLIARYEKKMPILTGTASREV